jgi:hypothetical protein
MTNAPVRGIPNQRLIFRWQQRKGKCYNPQGLCVRCGCPTASKHDQHCQACLTLFRYQGEDEADYQDTIDSVRGDWHP